MSDEPALRHSLTRAFRLAARRESPDALLDGWHLLHEAAAARLAVRVVALTGAPPSVPDRDLLTTLATARHSRLFGPHSDARLAATEIITVSASQLRTLSPARTPSGVVALATPRTHDLAALWQPAPALVVCARIQDPGNAGAIVRVAEAAGASGVLFTSGSADPWGWKALRAAMGSTFRLPVLRADGSPEQDVLTSLRQHGLTRIAATPQGGVPMYDLDWRRPTLLMLGSEGEGLDPATLASADAHVSIPMHRGPESLNVAVAAAVLLYEARRQRQTLPERFAAASSPGRYP